MSKKDLREIFDAYTDPRNDTFALLQTLSSVQKQFGEDWIQHVIACMYGMEIQDAGQFPEEWLNEIDDVGPDADEMEAISKASMGRTPRHP